MGFYDMLEFYDHRHPHHQLQLPCKKVKKSKIKQSL